MALTKRIDELDPYDSIDVEKRKKDLFEVSKNEGTYDDPAYLVGGSRKITQEELEGMLGYIPYSNANCEFVKNNGTALENGTRLLLAIQACYGKTPNGSPLSNVNRATVYLLNGIHDIGTSKIDLGEYVDIKSLSTKESVIVTSSNTTATFNVTGSHDYSLSGFTINNTGGGLSIDITPAIDNGVWFDLVLNANTRQQKNYNGQYGFITCNALCFGGNISGHIYNSTGTIAYSPTGSITISGIIEDCQGPDGVFGCSLAGSVIITGKIKNCKAGANSFGYTQAPNTYLVSISGIIENCESDNTFCFGAAAQNNIQVIISGQILNCKSGGFSFGYASAGFSQVSGKIDNCHVIEISGANKRNAFGSTTVDGVLRNCTGNNSHGVHLGLIDNCRFENEEGAFLNTLKIGDGCSVIFSKILQYEPTFDSIIIAEDAEVRITHCESNQEFNLISGGAYVNLVPIPNNVIWTETGIKIPSPDGSIWRLTIDDTGIPTTELI